MGGLGGHVHWIGDAFERTQGPQPDGVRDGFIAATQAALASAPREADPHSGQRFEADLLSPPDRSLLMIIQLS